MKSIVLDKITIKSNLVEYHYSCSKELDKFFTTKTMFVEYDESIDNVPLSILTIPFVNCMLGLTWLSDSVLYVDKIDRTYYNSISSQKRAFEELYRYPNLKGLFVPSIIENNEVSISNNSILLFGGGIDCHSSYLRNSENVKYILNIYGWLESLEENNKIDIADRLTTEKFAETMGISALHARSNFASQFNLSEIDKRLTSQIGSSYWLAFLHSMAFISLAVPLAWNKDVNEIIIASSFTKNYENRWCGSYITTDSAFQYAHNGRVLHDGFELNRQEKVQLIVSFQQKTKQPYKLQVCSFNESNCCECEKCFRTILDIIALGGDPSLFGFESYSKEHWSKILERDVAQWGIAKESYFYQYAENKMKENYQNIRYKEFVDWFLSCDFIKMKKNALRKYYRKYFLSIIKRKLNIK